MAKKKKYYSSMRDSGMIKEDHSAPGNLPRDVIDKMYPSIEYVEQFYSNDPKRRDDQMNKMAREARKQLIK